MIISKIILKLISELEKSSLVHSNPYVYTPDVDDIQRLINWKPIFYADKIEEKPSSSDRLSLSASSSSSSDSSDEPYDITDKKSKKKRKKRLKRSEESDSGSKPDTPKSKLLALPPPEPIKIEGIARTPNNSQELVSAVSRKTNHLYVNPGMTGDEMRSK